VIIQFVLSGLTTGAIYALVALGFTLIYSCSDVINFSQGEFVMIGGMTAAILCETGIPLPVAIIIAIAVACVIGGLVYELAIRPARTNDRVVIIILTIGVAIFIKGIAQVVFGKQLHKLPYFSGEAPIHFLGATLTTQALWVLGGAAAIMALLLVFFRFSIAGKSFIAMSANRFAALLVGTNVRLNLLVSFCLSATIGAIGGILITPITTTSFEAGTFLALKGFAAAVLGGLGNAPGAVLGGLLLGTLEALSAGYLSSTFKDAIAFLLIILIMLVFPQGIFSPRQHERV